MIWDQNVEDIVLDLIRNELSYALTKEALNSFGFITAEEKYLEGSATRLALVYSSTDYVFTSIELDWLKYADKVFLYQILENTNILFANMVCNKKDYYVHCAAMIKLLNIAIDGNNIFVFKIDDAFTLGSQRVFGSSLKGNFTVGALIDAFNYNDYEELFDGLTWCKTDDIPSLIISESPQEKWNEKKYDQKKRLTIDYIEQLVQLCTEYSGRNITCEDIFSYDTGEDDTFVDSYWLTRNDLQEIGEKEIASSYEELEKAEEAEKLAQKKQSIFDSEVAPNTIERNHNETFSADAFNNAEIMLKEILDRDK